MENVENKTQETEKKKSTVIKWGKRVLIGAVVIETTVWGNKRGPKGW